MMKYQEILKKELEYVLSKGGYHQIREADRKLNQFARAEIRAFKSDFGKCYLIKLSSLETGKPVLKEYTHGIVYNFQFDYMTGSKEQAEKLYSLAKIDYTKAWQYAHKEKDIAHLTFN